MLNRLLQVFYRSPNNGRQVISTTSGRHLLQHSEVSGNCDISVRRESENSSQVLGKGFGGCLISCGEQLHAAWSFEGGIQHTAARIDANPADWSSPAPILEAEAWLGDLFMHQGKPCALYLKAPDDDSSTIEMATADNDAWGHQKLWQTGPAYPPVCHADDEGRLHLAWGDVPGRLWYGLVDPQGEPSEPTLVTEVGRQPSIITVGDEALIVYEDDYPHTEWVLLKEGEILKKDRLLVHPWFTGSLVHSPQLAVDRHGVAWCFFVDNTRKSTFWMRWMGDAFGEIANGPRIHFRPQHFDWNLLPVGRLSVQKDASVSEDIGLLMSLEPPLLGQHFRRQSVPGIPTAADSKVLFFDGLEFSSMKGTEIVVNEAEKHPDNPLMDTGPPGSFDDDRVFNHGAVLKDGERYRMWYGAIHEPGPGVPWWDTISCGYAESNDGIKWERTPVGLAEWDGNKENNLVPHLRHAPLMIRDDRDPDPQRRYKSLYVWNSGEMGEMARRGKYGIQYDPRSEMFPAILFTSPDGLNLTPNEAKIVFPDGCSKPFSIIPESFFYDANEPDENRRWKAYGFMSLNLRRRGGAFLYSRDAITWYAYPENPVLDPSVRGIPAVVGGPQSQVHDTVVFPYGHYYIALYQNQMDSDRLDVELAISRDGETFTFVQPGKKIIPLGKEGDWDSEHLLQTLPVILDEEIRIYYGGAKEYDVPVEHRERLGTRSVKALPGLATLRRDGFTCMQLSAGASEGTFTTIPFKMESPRSIHMNAERGDGDLQIEVLDAATSESVKGYGLSESLPFNNGFDQPFAWAQHHTLPTGRGIRLSFKLVGNVRLYSFRFNSV